MQSKTLETLIKVAEQKLDEMLRNRREMEVHIDILEQEMEAAISELNAEAELAAADPAGAGRDFAAYSKEKTIQIQENQSEIHLTENSIEALQKEIVAAHTEKKKYENLLVKQQKKEMAEEKHRQTKEMDEIAAKAGKNTD